LLLFEWIRDIQDINALHSIDPFKHENGRVNNTTLLVIAQIRLRLATPATTATRTKTKVGCQAFGVSGSKLETQATERLYKDAPPGTPRFIPLLYVEPLTYFSLK
jgi:hypothetical protein